MAPSATPSSTSVVTTQAFAEYDRLAAAGPSVAAYARVAFARQLEGRRLAAIDAMELALEAGSGIPEQEAWAQVQYGNMLLGVGRLAAAEDAYRTARALSPGYVHADAGLARVDAARGRYARSAERLQAVIERLPAPQYAILLTDVLRKAGRSPEAARADRLVDALERLLAANGVRTELSTAIHDLDRGVRVGDALKRARVGICCGPERGSGRCDRVGALPHRKLWRGSGVGLEGRATRDAGRALLLPPRDDRALPRKRRRSSLGVPAGASDRPELLVPLEQRREEVRLMRRSALLLAALLVAVGAILVASPAASAHPLGNFTVNHFAGVDLAGDRVYVRLALDLAEIPTFQEGAEVRRPGYAASLAKQLELTIDGRRVPLAVVAHRTSQRAGAGGLEDPALRRDLRCARLRPHASPSRTGRSRAGSAGGRSRSMRATARA